ncbi:VCBS repeat-containing protein, partial [Candidatus Peregrinibacteria bacterium]|nr:VCBS repeat-containing protein [Candidatus Peregrinibacteria bacterium]
MNINTKKSFSRCVFAVFLSVLVISPMSLFSSATAADPVSNDWIQSSWSGGQSTNTASQTGWTQYSDALNLTTGNDLTLAKSTTSISPLVETKADDFNNGTKYHVDVKSGTDDDGSLSLTYADSSIDWERFGLKLPGLNNPMLAFGDLDSDGIPDLLVGSSNYNSVYAFRNTGSESAPVWEHQPSWEPSGISLGYYLAPALGDLDHDGDLDLLVGSSSSLHALKNTGTILAPTWKEESLWTDNLPPFSSHAVSPALADVDGDSDLDLLVG